MTEITSPLRDRRQDDQAGGPHECPAMSALDARFAAGTERMRNLEAKIDANSADTREVLDILHAGKGFFKVVGWFGNTVKWAALVAAPVITFWYTVKGGGK